MKKNSLNTAVLASLAGIAGIANISNAVNVNPDGTGQVLIYPYYTANAGNQTILSVVNTTNQGKAVKVRFLEGRNSQEVLDFNLFLSREDVWTAAILNLGGATSAASILTFDTSCTAPLFSSAGTTTASGVPYVDFRSALYQSDVEGTTGLDRTREGHFELIEMATIINGSPLGLSITHVSGTDRPPATATTGCGPVALSGGTGAFFIEAPLANASLTNPSGGLFGGAAVLNVANGTYTNYNATALDGFWAPNVVSGYTPPDSLLPSLTDVVPQSLVFSNGRIITSNWGGARIAPDDFTNGQRVDAISAVFMSDTLLNEYTTETALNAASEWVITYPTKRFYVNNIFADAAQTIPAALPPFTRPYVNGQACESLVFTSWNREEFTSLTNCQTTPTAPGCGFSPPAANNAPPSSLCFETNILSFNQTIANVGNGTTTPSKILGSVHTRNIVTPSITPTSKAGWTRVQQAISATGGPTVRRTRFSTENHRFLGLPTLGFWAISVENNNATPGVKGFYGGAYNHKQGRRCDSGTAAPFGSCFNP
jgi:hypothetical protein